MYNVFTKTIFSLFLALILLLNLIYFFDFTQLFFVSGYFVSYHDKYLGFSTLLNFFSGGFVEDSSYLVGFQNFLNDWLVKTKNAIYGNWVTFSNNGGVTDIISFFEVFANVFASIGGFLSMLLYIVMLAIYVISVFVWICLKFLMFLTGNYFTYVPLSPYVTSPVI